MHFAAPLGDCQACQGHANRETDALNDYTRLAGLEKDIEIHDFPPLNCNHEHLSIVVSRSMRHDLLNSILSYTIMAALPMLSLSSKC